MVEFVVNVFMGTQLAMGHSSFKNKVVLVFLYKKPSSRPSTRSFLIFGHSSVLKVS